MGKSPPQGMDRRAFLKASGAIGLGTVAASGLPGSLSVHPGPQVAEKTTGEMIDMFPHILPTKYSAALLKKAKPCYYFEANRIRPALANLEGET